MTKEPSLKDMVFNRARLVFSNYNYGLFSKAKATRKLEKLLDEYKEIEE